MRRLSIHYSDLMDERGARAIEPQTELPSVFADWFADRGWRPRRHQLELVERAGRGESALLIAPTGGGKTLAGFLPSLIELADRPRAKAGMRAPRLHTLYISPLKALAVDVARNVETPVREMQLGIEVETRTGDTPPGRRQRQRRSPPDILMTTPEQVALLLAYRDSSRFFKSLRYIIIDELHSLINSKRGELLALALARLSRLAPEVRRIGLSATVAEPEYLRRYLVPQCDLSVTKTPKLESQELAPRERLSSLIIGEPGATPELRILASEEHIPWSGHTARHALPEVYEAIRKARTALIFVNTRSQAEMIFQELWRINDDGLAIALHHGSLAVEQRRKVEAAMIAGSLQAVVCTSTLDLGVDWGEVDLVITVGAPKGASRLTQRIGRSNHRLDEPSRALLVPANRFEVLECKAARDAVHEGVLDGNPPRQGGLDVLAQHVLGMACAEPFNPDELYTEVRSAAPYTHVTRDNFNQVVDFVSTGGYALRQYERYKRIRLNDRGRFQVANPRVAQQYRLNVGTIVEAPMVDVRLVCKVSRQPAGARSGRKLGEVEEWFVEQLMPDDTFLLSGEVLRFEAMHENAAIVTRAAEESPKVPSYQGGKFPLSTYLAGRVRQMLSSPKNWKQLPAPVTEWLAIQDMRSLLPKPHELLVETFPRSGKYFMVCYPFDGRLVHQSLGMLLSRRLERMRMRPLGFVASEYALAIWGLRDLSKIDLGELFDEDMMGDDLDAWLAESNLLKRTFRNCAIIAGLIQRRYPGQEKSGRQVTFSSDLIYDVLREHEPNHILLRATQQDAATGLLDIARLGQLLKRIKNNIIVARLTRVSPLAVPVLLEIGRESVHGEASDAILADAAEDLIAEATRLDDPRLSSRR